MTYPPDETMAVLCALVYGVRAEFSLEGGWVAVYMPDGRAFEVGEGDALDDLFGRGWAYAAGDELGATESGRYWLRRWAKANRVTLPGG